MRIVLHSFEGRFSDSPRALHAALVAREGDHDVVWLAALEHLAAFPADVATLPWGSTAATDALEAADLVIANTHTDVPWRRRPGAAYLQTWHGTPLKRVHRDVRWAPEGVHERLQRDVDQWTHLLSPNRPSTPLLRRAFRYDGEVLETGLPRNDILLGADRDAVRARTRAQLGIDDGRTVVLYAPTWRDDLVLGGGHDATLHLDVDLFADALGDDHVLLLRLHHLVRGWLAASEHPAVRDVSAHPDISELYLAADVLVTDYSSTMFDFALTGRPILLFTYDLDDYRDRVRGFYFDLAAMAPGPLLSTTAELVAALRELPAVVAAHGGRYAAFRERFGELEDGHATERVLARILPV